MQIQGSLINKSLQLNHRNYFLSLRTVQAVLFLRHRGEYRKRVIGGGTAEKEAAKRLIKLQNVWSCCRVWCS